MSNGRFLSKSISQNEALPSVSIEAAILFTWSIPHLDRDGRMRGNPALIKSSVCPLLPIDSGSIPDLLRELGEVGLIRWFEVENVKVVEFPGFRNHQQGMKYDREAPSRLPPSTSANAQDLVRSKSGVSPDQVLLSEVKGNEVKSKLREEKKEPSVLKKSRLPKDWVPTEAHAERAKEYGLDLEWQADKFRIDCEAKGRTAEKWNAAFTTWLMNAKEWAKPGSNGSHPSPVRSELQRIVIAPHD